MTIEEMKKRKKELGLTNRQLSDRSGVPVGTINKIFACKTESPRYDTIQKLNKVLGKTISNKVYSYNAQDYKPDYASEFCDAYMLQTTVKDGGDSWAFLLPKFAISGLDIKEEDVFDVSVDNSDVIKLKKVFRHRTFEERLSEYNNDISVLSFDWGEPTGKELL